MPLSINRPFKHKPGVPWTPPPNPSSDRGPQIHSKPDFVESDDEEYRKGWPPEGEQGENYRWETLRPGTTIDRFGSDQGSWLSPVGTTFEKRAIEESSYGKGYYVYEVVRPFNTMSSDITEAQGYPGGGIQHDIRPLSVQDLLNADPPFLREVQVTR